jgi:WD40 repeat protein
VARSIAGRALAAVVFASAAIAAAEPGKAPTFVGHGMGPVSFLRFSPDGKELVRICQFGGVEMLATGGFDRMRTFEIGMRMVAFDPDGTRLATAEGTDGARVWDAMLPGKAVPAADTPAPWVREVRVLETPLKVLETKSSAGVNSLETRADKKRVLWAEFSPDGRRLLTTQVDGHVKVWTAGSWTLESDLTVTDAELFLAVFAPDGKTILGSDAKGRLREWSLETKKEVRTLHAPAAVTGVVFAPQGGGFSTVQGSFTASSVSFWGPDGRLLETRDGASSVAVSRDGKRLALGGKRVDFLDPASRAVVRTVELPSVTLRESNPAFASDPDADRKVPVSVVALAFSPDGATLAAGCLDGSIRLIPVAP